MQLSILRYLAHDHTHTRDHTLHHHVHVNIDQLSGSKGYPNFEPCPLGQDKNDEKMMSASVSKMGNCEGIIWFLWAFGFFLSIKVFQIIDGPFQAGRSPFPALFWGELLGNSWGMLGQAAESHGRHTLSSRCGQLQLSPLANWWDMIGKWELQRGNKC